MSTSARTAARSVLCVFALAVFATAPAYAQGSATSSIAGTVVDTSGAGVPGADITATDASNGAVFRGVSSDNGAFTIPAIPTGTYSVSVALQGFKTAVLKDVVVTAGGPASIKATLQIGGVEETVTVASTSEIIQTQSTAVSTTLSARQIANLPVPGRAAFDLAIYMPGVTTTDGTVRGVDRQRPAAERGQHHPRRHEHPGQLPEDVRRHVHARQPAPRRGRRGHRRDRGAGRRQRRPGRACRSSSSPSRAPTVTPAAATTTCGATG